MGNSKLYIISGSSSSPALSIHSTKSSRHHPTVYSQKFDNDGTITGQPQGAYVVPNAVLVGSFVRALQVSSDPDDYPITGDVSYIVAASNDGSMNSHDFRTAWGAIGDVLANPVAPQTSVSQSPPSPEPQPQPQPTTTKASPPKTTSAPQSTQSTLSVAGKAISRFCTSSNSFCLTAIRDGTSNNVIFALQSTYTGYSAFGVGSSTMTGSTIYVGWGDGKGGYVVSQRDSSGQSTPEQGSTSQTFKIVAFPSDGTVAPLSGAVTQFAIERPASDSSAKAVSVTGGTDFIWAGDNRAISNPGSSTASISRHTGGNYGSFNLDVSKLGTSSTGSGTGSQYDVQFMRLLHGVFMFIAWGVLPFVGIFIARYMKDKLGHLWYILHLSIMMGGVGAFTLAGLICIELPYTGNNRFFGTYHGLFGFVLAVLLLPVQIALGFVSNHLWSPDRKSIPWWDQMHWWIGRISVMGSVLIMYWGLKAFEASNLAHFGFFFWIGLGLVVMVGGQFAIGVVHHVGGKKEEEVAMSPMSAGLGSGVRTDNKNRKF
ncbi:hypothetical protein HDU97_008518 [Phlyctochytrium planicorne]|nr:hypothetical protein HDU97_008518 [Phlyctochytrium planicorne]